MRALGRPLAPFFHCLNCSPEFTQLPFQKLFAKYDDAYKFIGLAEGDPWRLITAHKHAYHVLMQIKRLHQGLNPRSLWLCYYQLLLCNHAIYIADSYYVLGECKSGKRWLRYSKFSRVLADFDTTEQHPVIKILLAHRTHLAKAHQTTRQLKTKVDAYEGHLRKSHSFRTPYFWHMNSGVDYGGADQARLWQKLAIQVCKQSVEKMSIASWESGPPYPVFIQFLQWLGDQRNTMANLTQSRFPERFGVLRVLTELDLRTKLAERYVSCSYDLKEIIVRQLYRRLLGRRLTRKMIFVRETTTTFTTIKCMPTALLAGLEANHPLRAIFEYEKEHLYQQKSSAFATLSTLIIMQVFFLCDGQWVPVSSVITGLFQENVEQPVTEHDLYHFLKQSPVFLRHTPHKTLQPLLEHISHLWRRAICFDCNEHNQQALLALIAEIHYWMSHASAYERGSAAISEWITKALFMLHGFSMPETKPMVLLDLKAFVMTLEDYVRAFPSFFKSHPLERPLEQGIEEQGIEVETASAHASP